MNRLEFLKKLLEEYQATKPVVRETSQALGNLKRDEQLAEGQKIIQKLDKDSVTLNKWKNAAGIAGAVGATSLMSQEEAEAAGITDIAKRLGVSLEKAADIKSLAKSKVANDVWEENIRAIQEVSKFKRDPSSMTEIGRGVDAIAYDAGDNVVKAPRLGKLGQAWNAERMNIIPSIVEDTGMGAKTKIIKTSGNKYQVQEKLSPLSDVTITHPKFTEDKMLNELKDRELELMYNSKGQKRKLTDKQNKELDDVRKQYSDRESQLFDELNLPEEILDRRPHVNAVDSDKAEAYMIRRLNQKVGSTFEPRDLHSENVGLDKQGQMKVLDTGNFMQLDKSKMTPAMRKKAIENYIALPEEKARFIENLNAPSPAVKKAAAVAPFMSTQEEFVNKPVEALKEAYTTVRKPILDATRKLGEGISDIARVPGMLSPEAIAQERSIAGTAAQIGLDPLNLVSGGAGAALGAADVGLYNEPINASNDESEEAYKKALINAAKSGNMP